MTSENNLQICSRCNTGRMRPTGKVGVQGEKVEPFGEVGNARRYECDNCGHVEFNASITERIEESERLTGSAEKND